MLNDFETQQKICVTFFIANFKILKQKMILNFNLLQNDGDFSKIIKNQVLIRW